MDKKKNRIEALELTIRHFEQKRDKAVQRIQEASEALAKLKKDSA